MIQQPNNVLIPLLFWYSCLFVCLFFTGTTTTLTATTLCSLYGQPRIFFRMARDGLLFERFGVVNAKGVPTFGVWVTCAGASVLSALFDLGSLAEMIPLIAATENNN